MKAGNRSSALLVELMIVVVFFMLAATVLLRVFAAAHDQGRQADIKIRALNEAQNVADRLYAADEPEAALAGMGFAMEEETWVLAEEGYVLYVTSRWEDREQGRMRIQEVRAEAAGETVLSLPCSRYEEGRR